MSMVAAVLIRVEGGLKDGGSRPVISSGKIESRTSRSSICSSRPMLPYFRRLHGRVRQRSGWDRGMFDAVIKIR